MAQHDYVIENANGATVRADINNALLAISSTNSGSSEPSTTYAYEMWVDTTGNLLKLRNGANSAWITLGVSVVDSNAVDINSGAIDGTPVGETVASTGDFTTLTAAGTLTVGVDDTGYDVKFFGDTSGAYLLWDESADKLLTAGGAVVDIVKDKFMIGGTAVTTTANELNILDGVTATATELNYVDGVTSAIQTQMDTKASVGKAIAMAMVFG